MKLNKLFEYQTGNLPALELTEDGNVPLVYGTTRNNGVVKLVKVDEDTKIFEPNVITVSYLGTAFVQTIAFTTSVVDKSNITVLVPRDQMSLEQLYFYAYQINKIAKFGFNYGRRMNQKQLNKIELTLYTSKIFDVKIKEKLPNKINNKDIPKEIRFKQFEITRFFDIVKGTGLYRQSYSSGDTPLVSATSFNNGIIGHVNAAPLFPAKTITVERIKGSAFVQLQDYITVPDDISVLKPKFDLSLEVLYFFAYLIRRESWRYSYGRKLSPTRLKGFVFELPVDNNDSLDTNLISDLVGNCYGWSMVIGEFYSRNTASPDFYK